MMYGRNLRSWIDNVRIHQKPKRNDTEAKFKLNDLVLARIYRQKQKWTQGRVVRVIGTRFLLIQTNEGILRRHQDQLLPSKVQISGSNAPQAPQWMMMDGGNEVSQEQRTETPVHSNDNSFLRNEPHDETYIPSQDVSITNAEIPRRSTRIFQRTTQPVYFS
ncbi:hypothetical protein RF11_08966 [Thelohanellus kitauei]|uniref:DUF5641 domain-containing protein n=1 Tax=Thelohanellus kitauei TaxID=669202 RepID=A0A0C2M6X9_THEKT|nr:hypothetical protein RF11_08966 [Thelohanellus kitauei]